MLPTPWWVLSPLANDLTVTIRVMPSSSNEMSPSVSDCVKCKQKKIDAYALIP